MKTILLTGSQGFIGQNLMPDLHALGYKVVQLHYSLKIKANTPQQIYLAPPLHIDQIIQELEHLNPDAILHLASASPLASENEHAQITLDFSIKLIHAMKSVFPHTPFFTMGSAAEYGSTQKENYALKETDHCSPTNAYGKAKNQVSQIAQKLWEQGYPITVLRLFTAVGAAMPNHLTLGKAAQHILTSSPHHPLYIHSFSAMRDYLSIHEVIRILLQFINKTQALPPIVNIASGYPLNTAQIIQAMIQFSGKSYILREQTPASFFIPHSIYADTSLLNSLHIHPLIPNIPQLATHALGKTIHAPIPLAQ
jgi:nucleoside-diphosphate-sugar epimerase